ncbi:MAG TPA: DUF4178 domain-containing protein [Rhodocyclaceae bacterium]
MARTASCPSCGATVEFRSAVSILAVCDYCQSTLLRQGEALENLGRMAELIEDRSPVQRGAEGNWKGRHFVVIGRLQLRYEAGLWNEWHLLFDDGKSGWLSEAGGEYVVSEALWYPDPLPPYGELQVGQVFNIGDKAFSVSNLITGECVAGAGELPFKVGAGYPAPSADLRDEAGRFATFDYSEEDGRPLVFVGESVAFASLGWSNLRQDAAAAAPTVKARSFNCPACGAPLKLNQEDTKTVGCGSCGAVLDTSNETVKKISGATELSRLPRIPIGSRGSLRGEALEVIGYLARSCKVDGEVSDWSEYLLLAPDGSQRWLVEARGHWSLGRVLSRSVVPQDGKIFLDSEEFKHFERYKAEVDIVLGEFSWRVRRGDKVAVDDYIAPPRMLSREYDQKEATWTVAEYLEPEEVWQAFKLAEAPPERQGVGANQPNHRAERHRRMCRSFWRCAGLAVAIHLLLVWFGPGSRLVDLPINFSAEGEGHHETADFVLTGADNRVLVEADSDASNNWVALDLALINKDSGEAWNTKSELSHYSGVEDNESWSEGSNSDHVVFAGVPPGTYFISVDHDMDDNASNIHGRIQVKRPGPQWSPLVLTLLFLSLFPIFTSFNSYSFEVDRWEESDHPLIKESKSGDDEDD